MTYNEGIQKVKAALQFPLPGVTVQHFMAPALRKTTTELLDENPSHRLSSVLLLLFPGKDGNLNTLFIERPGGNSIHSGQIALPGGKVESFDDSPRHAALRETEEEIGVPAISIEIIGTLTSLYIPASNFLVIPHIGVMNSLPEFNPNPLEVTSIIELAVSDLLELQSLEKIFLTSYGNLYAPYFDIQGHSLWGATAMIVSEFREMIRTM